MEDNVNPWPSHIRDMVSIVCLCVVIVYAFSGMRGCNHLGDIERKYLIDSINNSHRVYMDTSTHKIIPPVSF